MNVGQLREALIGVPAEVEVSVIDTASGVELTLNDTEYNYFYQDNMFCFEVAEEYDYEGDDDEDDDTVVITEDENGDPVAETSELSPDVCSPVIEAEFTVLEDAEEAKPRIAALKAIEKRLIL